jgi:hypothetical protein
MDSSTSELFQEMRMALVFIKMFISIYKTSLEIVTEYLVSGYKFAPSKLQFSFLFELVQAFSLKSISDCPNIN